MEHCLLRTTRVTYTVGIDFGTESARSVLVDCSDGLEVATCVYEYANGVIDQCLPAPDEDVVLPSDWALQDPRDYMRALEQVRPLLNDAGVAAEQVKRDRDRFSPRARCCQHSVMARPYLCSMI